MTIRRGFYLFVFFLLISSGLFFHLSLVRAAGENWLTGWSYRKQITISGSSSGLVSNYQMKFTIYQGAGTDSRASVYLNNHGAADYADLRFTTSDGQTLLDYYVESSDATSATVWVEFNSIPVGSSSFYLYYGDASATSESSGGNTFAFFDDFLGTSLDTDKWESATSLGSVSVSGGNLIVSGATSASCGINGVRSKTATFNAPYVMESRYSMTNVNNSWAWRMVGMSAVSIITTGENCHTLHTDGIFYHQGDNNPYFRTVAIDPDYTNTVQTAITDTYIGGIYYKTGDVPDARYTRNYGSVLATHTSSLTTEPLRLMLTVGNNTGSSAVVADWVRIRNYTDPEPSVSSWGAEETLPTPTPTSTQSSSINNSGSSATTFSAFNCTAEKPLSVPDVFRLDAKDNKVTLYFAPLPGAISGYTVSYGTNEKADQYTVSFDWQDKAGVVPYTVKSLNLEEKWYFKVRGNNGCMPGDWSLIKSTSSETSVVQKITGEPLKNLLSETVKKQEEITPSVTKIPGVYGASVVEPQEKKSFTWTMPKLSLPKIKTPQISLGFLEQWRKEAFKNIKLTAMTMVTIKQLVAEKNQTMVEKINLSVETLGAIWFDKKPTMIADVKVEEKGEDFVIISWLTNHPATSKVNWGESYDYGKSKQLDDLTTEHKVRIEGLVPGKTYYYEVMSEGKNYVFDARHEFSL